MTELNIIDGQTTNDPALMATTTASVHIRAPKRVIHFSDGTLEEYSDDDDRIDHSEKMNNDNNSNQQIDVVSVCIRCNRKQKEIQNHCSTHI